MLENKEGISAKENVIQFRLFYEVTATFIEHSLYANSVITLSQFVLQ